MKTREKIIVYGIGVVYFSLLPIWRSGKLRHINFWQLIANASNHEFITYDEAVARAKMAYEKLI